MKNNFNYTEIESKLGYTFMNKKLLLQAFTRSSYSAEHYDAENNEILEFIGDSILGMLTVKRLTERYGTSNNNYFISELHEDDLSKLKTFVVKRQTLAKAISSVGLSEYLLVGNSDEKLSVRNEESVMEDLFESIVGAVAIDSKWNLQSLEKVILHLLNIDNIIESDYLGSIDYENELQKWFDSKNEVMHFEIVNHYCGDLEYAVCINLGIRMLNFEATGYGETERGARQMAAKRALEFIGNTTDREKKILLAVGKPDPDRAVNQLQELWQKKIITEPKYVFLESYKSESGNSFWECTCTIEGLYDSNGGYVCESKSKAKKQVAYEALMYLIGTDIGSLFTKYGNKIEEEN